jgi:predicted transposase YbfD/YdcC
VEEAARAIRGHWMVESYHWHLDVTFREDANHTLDKAAAYNLEGDLKSMMKIKRNHN